MIIYQRSDRNTTPTGFGNEPTYHVRKPRTSDFDMIWSAEIEINIPDGYMLCETGYGGAALYDAKGNLYIIVDDNWHPAIVTGVWRNDGRVGPVYKRLDK